MEKGIKKPEIRFTGFTDDWEQRNFSNCYKMSSGYAFKYEDYCESGVGLINGESIQHGRIDDANLNYLPSDFVTRYNDFILHEGDIVVGLNRPITNGNLKIARIPHKYNDSLLYQRAGKIDYKMEADKDFSYVLLSQEILKHTLKEAVGSDQPFISTSKLDKWEMIIPSNIEEQEKIGTYFKQLDHLITLHQRKYDKLVNVKKSMLEKMFPKKGEKKPEIRFAGFTDDWEQRKFGEIVQKYEDPVATPHDGYTRLGIRSHAKGTFHSFVEKGQELETAQMYKVDAGNFIVNITFGWEHAVAITDENDAGKLVSHRFPQYQFIKGMVPTFFKYVILDENFRHHLWLASPGGAGRNRVLNLNEMLEYKMVFPSESEQTKIASYFKQLDHLITLHQRKLELMKNIKKAMLEKMLV